MVFHGENVSQAKILRTVDTAAACPRQFIRHALGSTRLSFIRSSEVHSVADTSALSHGWDLDGAVSVPTSVTEESQNEW